MARASDRGTVSTRQQRIAELARQSPSMGFTSLNHHLDLLWLLQAHNQTRHDGAAGVDGQTGTDYAADLVNNLRTLLERAKSGTYRAPAVRRVRIPKGTGTETRPLGIPTYEDKVLQRAVVMLLEPIYEQDFCNCSYGFRPGRSAHQALEALWRQTMDLGGCWLLEVDIRKFFDTLDHAQLRTLLQRRVDGMVLRLIGKWLNAGVLEDGVLEHAGGRNAAGRDLSASGQHLSALMCWMSGSSGRSSRVWAVVPSWFGAMDDFVIGFAREEDAQRVVKVLPQRFAAWLDAAPG